MASDMPHAISCIKLNIKHTTDTNTSYNAGTTLYPLEKAVVSHISEKLLTLTRNHNNVYYGQLIRQLYMLCSFRQKLPSYGDPGSQRRRNGQVPSMNTLVEIIHHRHAFDKAARVRLRDR